MAYWKVSTTAAPPPDTAIPCKLQDRRGWPEATPREAGGPRGGGELIKKETTFEHSYVDTLLDIKLPEEGDRPLTDAEMVNLCAEFLNAGTDTTSTGLQWIMAELVKNPAIQEKLYEEISSATTGDEQILLPPPHGARCLDAAAEEALGERREEGEDGNFPGDVEQLVALRGGD